MIVDSYVSYGPSLENHSNRLLRPLDDASNAEALIAVLDRVGVDRAIIYPPRWIGGRHGDPEYREANAAVAEAVRAFPGRLSGGARVNPNYGAAAVELDAMLRRVRVQGASHSTLNGSNVDPRDENLVYPLVRARPERGRAGARRVPLELR